MERREWLKLAATLTAGVFTAPALGQRIGRKIKRDSITRYGAERPDIAHVGPSFYDEFSPFRGVASQTRKNCFLWEHLRKDLGEIVPHYQGPNGEGLDGEGDCVAQAAGMACDILASVNRHMLGRNERWVAKSSVEMIYAGSRIEIGKAKANGVNSLAGRGGSHCEWAAEYLKNYGVLHRIKYPGFDLTGYDPARSRKYRDKGVPDSLEKIAREHPVLEFSKVNGGQEALDAVCAGQLVLIGSSYAFRNTRDADGFAMPYLGGSQQRRGRWGWFWLDIARKQWWHALLLSGAILEGGRVGGVIQNSHGDWIQGPNPYNFPKGAFGVDLQYLDLMVKDWGDCHALSAYKGHEAEQIRHTLY